MPGGHSARYGDGAIGGLVTRSLFRLLYRSLLAPLATVLYLVLVVPLFAKPRRLFQERIRQKRNRPKRIAKPSLWIHASSGEFEYAKNLIRELKKENPDLFIVATYSSPSYSAQITAFPGVDHAEPLPLDLPAALTDFIRTFEPQALLIARTDLWPELLWQCRRHKVPSVLFGASFPSEASFFGALWKKLVLQELDLILLTKPEDQTRLMSWGISTTAVVLGDPRFDQVEYRLHQQPALALEIPQDRLVLCAGSTWPEDEEHLIPATRPLLQKKSLRLIVAPHEPTPSHIESLKSKFKNGDLNCQLYSTKDHSVKDFDVLIIDRVGVLAQLYAFAQVGFVGGSFKRKVHSVMESLGAGLVTLVGPHHTNNREAVDFSQQQAGEGLAMVNAVKTTEEMQSMLEALCKLQETGKLQPLRHRIRQRFESELGATSRIIVTLKSKTILAHTGGKHERDALQPTT